MTAAFLPTLAEVEAAEGEAAMRASAARFLGTLLTILLAGVALVLLLMGPLASLLMGGRPEAQIRLTALLGRIMFPYLALVSLTAGFTALLNLRHRFALAAAVSIFWNLGFIGFGWAALRVIERQGPAPYETVAVVCAGAVLAGGVLQLLVLLPTVRKEGFSLSPGLHLGDPYVCSALRRMGPGMLAAGIYPINVVISAALASHLAVGAQTVLFNSGMMTEMVMGLFAMGLATAGLPLLARQAEAQDWPGMNQTLNQTLSASALLVLPASLGLMVLARPVCALLFRTGAYTVAASDWTALTMVYGCVGLVFVAGQRLGNQALYALKDYRGPAQPPAPAPAPMMMAAPMMQAPQQVYQAAPLAPAPAAAPVPVEDPNIHYVTSPIVGTFYRSSNPTASPFVSQGDFVKPGQTLCIIEAMKLMNEIECDVAGEVVKVLVENGTPVEYGERLFAVRIG